MKLLHMKNLSEQFLGLLPFTSAEATISHIPYTRNNKAPT